MTEHNGLQQGGNRGQFAATLGAIAAAFCCAGLPLVAALLASLGLSFLRNDWLLYPVEFSCFILVVRGLIRNRSRHGRNRPLLLGVTGLALLLIGMLARGVASSMCLFVGASLLSWGLVQDRVPRRAPGN